MVRPNPLLTQDLFVGRQHQVRQLAGLLGNGHSVLLVGGRRGGKITLACQLSSELVGRSLIHTDASGWDLTSEATALGAIRAAIEGRPETAQCDASRDFIAAALDRVLPTTVVVDEADRLLQARWCAQFFAFLRYLDDTRLRGDISFLLLGGPVLVLYKDQDDHGSPPLNTAHPIHLEPLDHGAIGQLSTSPTPARAWTGARGHEARRRPGPADYTTARGDLVW